MGSTSWQRAESDVPRKPGGFNKARRCFWRQRGENGKVNYLFQNQGNQGCGVCWGGGGGGVLGFYLKARLPFLEESGCRGVEVSGPHYAR